MREAPAHPEVAPASPEEGVPRDSFARPVQVHSLSTHGLISLLYEELKWMAVQFLSRESPGHSMEAADLIHESVLMLDAQIRTSWKGRTHFLAVSAQAMRRILIDDARTRTRKKRGGKGRHRVDLQEHHAVSHDAPESALIVQEIIEKLGRLDLVHAKILRLRLFKGLKMDDIAQMLGVSSRTIERHWAMIRAWVLQQVASELPDHGICSSTRGANHGACGPEADEEP